MQTPPSIETLLARIKILEEENKALMEVWNAADVAEWASNKDRRVNKAAALRDLYQAVRKHRDWGKTWEHGPESFIL